MLGVKAHGAKLKLATVSTHNNRSTDEGHARRNTRLLTSKDDPTVLDRKAMSGVTSARFRSSAFEPTALLIKIYVRGRCDCEGIGVGKRLNFPEELMLCAGALSPNLSPNFRSSGRRLFVHREFSFPYVGERNRGKVGISPRCFGGAGRALISSSLNS